MLRRTPRSTLFPTRRSSDLIHAELKSFGKTRLLNIEILLREVQFFGKWNLLPIGIVHYPPQEIAQAHDHAHGCVIRSEEHTSELQSRQYLVCRLLLEKKKNK